MYRHRKLTTVVFFVLTLIGQSVSYAFSAHSMDHGHSVKPVEQAMSHCESEAMSMEMMSHQSMDSNSLNESCCPDNCTCPAGGCFSSAIIDSLDHVSVYGESRVYSDSLTSSLSDFSASLYRPPITA